MAKHSKNRTAAPVFSYAERQSTQYGSKKQRLGRDSMRNFDSCSLCLQRARDARMCEEGHLFCQECIVTSLLSQKKEIKRQQVLLEKMKVEEEQERELARQHARERVLQDFEKLQSGVAAAGSRVAGPSAPSSSSTASAAGSTTNGVGSVGDRGTKRKFDLDGDEVTRLQDEQEAKALREIEREQAEKRKAKLPNFWLPSLTPEAAPTKLSEVKLQTLCHAGSPAHPISLKSLTTVQFHTTEQASNGTASSTPASTSQKTNNGELEYTCPTCRKSLTNNVASYALKPCGHVLCNTCVETLVKASKPYQCAHCDTPLLAEKKKPIIALQREGTGYAAGGQAEAKRFDVAFEA